MKKALLLLPVLLVLASCSSKKSSSAKVTAVPFSNVSSPLNGGFGLSNTCPQGTNGIGSIFDNGQIQQSLSASGTFENRVKALLSASVASNEIGQISSQMSDPTGVRFQGIIKLDARGAVIAAQSQMIIKVYDHYVASGQLDANGAKYEPITIEFAPGQSVQTTGQFNLQTGEGYVSFRDSYGEVRFEGRLDAQNFTGVVKFQNTQNVNGGSALGGTLGQFMVARCGIIQ